MEQRTVAHIQAVCRRASPQPLEVKRDGLYSEDVPVAWATIDINGEPCLGLHEDDIALLCNGRNWIDALVFRIERLHKEQAKFYAEQYEWASIINRLACLALDNEISSNDRDYAQDMIEMVNPYLGLAEE